MPNDPSDVLAPKAEKLVTFLDVTATFWADRPNHLALLREVVMLLRERDVLVGVIVGAKTQHDGYFELQADIAVVARAAIARLHNEGSQHA